jgi:serine/threonine-protein kinase
MGEIYKATHTLLGAPRVIKVIHARIAGRDDAKDRFFREARIATKVQHQNVATLFDFAALPDGSHYMVWEFIDGENLAQRLRTRGTLPPRQALKIALQALHGLEAIHRAGIIHRDISPENLMITPDDTVKIIDLGVAKLEDPDAVTQTRTGIFVGKLRYASPEQLGFLPEGEKVDGRADLYAIAMVIVELLTGRPPYEAKSPHEYFLHHAREVPTSTVELPPNFPGGAALVDVLQKALSRNRDDRYATAHEFAVALEGILIKLPDPVVTATQAIPLDGDATWRPSMNQETMRTPSPFEPTVSTSATTGVLAADAKPTVAAAAAGVAAASAAAALPATPAVPPVTPVAQAQAPQPPAPPQMQPSMPPPLQPNAGQATVLTPLPEGGPRRSSSAGPVMAVLAIVLLLIGGAAYALWPRITQMVAPFTKISSSKVTADSGTPAPAKPSQTTLNVTPANTDTASKLTAQMTNPPAQQGQPQLLSQPQTTKPQTQTQAQVQPQPVYRPEGHPPQVAQVQPQPDAQPRTDVPVETVPRRPSVYIDRPGHYRGNERALDRLHNELRGVKEIALIGASDLVVYRTLHRYLPDVDFSNIEAPVAIRWESTSISNRFGSRYSQDLNGAGTVTITKNGRVIFRYNIPVGMGDQGAADAFGATLAEALAE